MELQSKNQIAVKIAGYEKSHHGVKLHKNITRVQLESVHHKSITTGQLITSVNHENSS